jgi:DNA-binding transcriptional regulator YiaG
MSPVEIRAARLALGLSTKQLAAVMEITQRWVQQWESGDRPIPGPARLAMAFMLRTPRARWPSARSTAADRGTQAG